MSWRLRKYFVHLFHKHVACCFPWHWSLSQAGIANLKDTFETLVNTFVFLDKNKDGYVSKDEMVEAINETTSGERSSGKIAMNRFRQYPLSLTHSHVHAHRDLSMLICKTIILIDLISRLKPLGSLYFIACDIKCTVYKTLCLTISSILLARYLNLNCYASLVETVMEFHFGIWVKLPFKTWFEWGSPWIK